VILLNADVFLVYKTITASNETKSRALAQVPALLSRQDTA
jgi:hypothetical protein